LASNREQVLLSEGDEDNPPTVDWGSTGRLCLRFSESVLT
jgi:hypothetical protein